MYNDCINYSKQHNKNMPTHIQVIEINVQISIVFWHRWQTTDSQMWKTRPCFEMNSALRLYTKQNNTKLQRGCFPISNPMSLWLVYGLWHYIWVTSHHITSLLLCTGLQPLSDESSPELQLLSLYLPAVCLLKEQNIWLIKTSFNSNIQKV